LITDLDLKKSERQYLAQLHSFGCVVCRKHLGVYTEPAMHHIRHGMGMGMRNSNDMVLPLCGPHHQTGGHGVALHAGQKTWEQNFGTEIELLEWLKEHL